MTHLAKIQNFQKYLGADSTMNNSHTTTKKLNIKPNFILSFFLETSDLKLNDRNKHQLKTYRSSKERKTEQPASTNKEHDILLCYPQ